MMNVLLVLITVSRYAVTQFHTGLVAAMLATAYVLITEHVKVVIMLLCFFIILLYH